MVYEVTRAEEIELKAANWQAMLQRVGYRNVYRRERIQNDDLNPCETPRACVRDARRLLSLSLSHVRAFRNSAFRASLLVLLFVALPSRPLHERREEKKRGDEYSECVIREIGARPVATIA